MPPLAPSVAEYGVPTWPVGSEVLVTRSVAGAIVSVKFAVLLRAGLPESVTLKVSGAAILVVGVPLMVPAVGFSESPAGRVPLVSAHW